MAITTYPPALPELRPSLAERRRVSILGVGIDAVSRADAGRALEAFVEEGGHHQVVTANIDFLSIATRNVGFKQLVNDADLVTADGTPLLWAARYLGASLPERITGPDLIQMAARHSLTQGSSMFFLGAAPGIAAAAVDHLREKYGNIGVAGVYSPPIGDLVGEEDVRIRRLIRDARPDFLFVALGCPKQDFWIDAHRDLDVPVAVGIGGSFDFLSGRIRRAPSWAQRGGLEWAFRLAHEPRRLAKRYLVDDVRTVAQIGLSKFRAREQEASSQRERA